MSDSNHDVVRVPPRPRHDADMEIARRPDAPVDTGAQIPLRRDGGRPQALGHVAVRRRDDRDDDGSVSNYGYRDQQKGVAVC